MPHDAYYLYTALICILKSIPSCLNSFVRANHATCMAPVKVALCCGWINIMVFVTFFVPRWFACCIDCFARNRRIGIIDRLHWCGGGETCDEGCLFGMFSSGCFRDLLAYLPGVRCRYGNKWIEFKIHEKLGHGDGRFAGCLG